MQCSMRKPGLFAAVPCPGIIEPWDSFRNVDDRANIPYIETEGHTMETKTLIDLDSLSENSGGTAGENRFQFRMDVYRNDNYVDYVP